MQVYDLRNNFKDVSEEWEFGKSNYWFSLHVSELNSLKTFMMLDEESLRECEDYKQPSKINFFYGYTFLVLNVLSFEEDYVVPKELNVFISKDYIITVYKEDFKILEELLEDIYSSKNCFIIKEKPVPSIFFYYLLDRVIISNYHVISQLEAEADKIEISILKAPKEEQIVELIHLRRQVYKVRKYLSPLMYIGESLVNNDNSIIDSDNLKYFRSITQKIEKLMLALESLVQDLALVREAFESEIANKTNGLLKIFTVIATIFLPLNLISSMYGMNVKHIPFVDWDYGYYYVLGIMLTISLSLILLFNKKKWL